MTVVPAATGLGPRLVVAAAAMVAAAAVAPALALPAEPAAVDFLVAVAPMVMVAAAAAQREEVPEDLLIVRRALPALVAPAPVVAAMPLLAVGEALVLPRPLMLRVATQ